LKHYAKFAGNSKAKVNAVASESSTNVGGRQQAVTNALRLRQKPAGEPDARSGGGIAEDCGKVVLMNETLLAELLASVEEMDKIVRGELEPGRVTRIAELPVRTIREKTGLSQRRFAHLIGVSKRTLENWEQGRRRPMGPARALLKIVSAAPEIAIKSLHG
jgi:putative transcriptional regulator